jgi:hypothetical protein
MHLIYARENPTSIFLAGPTPRDIETKSWRGEAFKWLAEIGYDGAVIIPEERSGECKEWDYDDQVFWEWKSLQIATCILFWVPRELTTMPAFTTNVEFGMWVKSGKVVYGRPSTAPKINYLDMLARQQGLSVHDNLYQTCFAAVQKTVSN